MKKEKSKSSKTEFRKLDLTDIETKQEEHPKSNIDDEMKLTDMKIKLKLKIVNELMTNDIDSVVLSLLNFILERSKIGRKKYQNDLDRTDGDLQYWIQNAIEEQLDNSLYLLKVGNVLNK